jgi:hypothetical protein
MDRNAQVFTDPSRQRGCERGVSLVASSSTPRPRRKPNTAATVGPQNNSRPGRNLLKNSPRKPPTLGTPIK